MYKKRVFLLIATFSILRIIIAANLDLGNDESYYWLYSQVLKWNYFDHPPMIAIWLRVFTANLMLEKYEVFLRLGSIVGCGLATWFMYKCVTTLTTERAGWFAACLYNASFYAGITAGLLIMPDAPQMVFYTFSLWMIAKITLNDKKWIYWILLGIASGLCIMSKVHGVFIWVGLGLYVLLKKRAWLLNPRMYTALIIALLITSPIVIWNVQNDFATYRFNSERIVIKGFSLNWSSFLREFVGQLVINNPLNIVIIFLSLFVWIRHPVNFPRAISIYNFIGLPFVLLLLFISVYRATLPHWSGPGYIALIPLAATGLEQLTKKLFYPKLIKLSLGAYITFLIVCSFVINFYPGNFGSTKKDELGKGDMTIDMYGWNEASKRFNTVYQNEIAKGIMPKNAPVVCNKWWGAHVEYYFCRPLNMQMIGLGEMNELHEYMWMNNMRKDKADFTKAYCIINSDDYYDVHEKYDNYYNKIDTVSNIEISRGNKTAHNFYIFRLQGWKNNLPVAK